MWNWNFIINESHGKIIDGKFQEVLCILRYNGMTSIKSPFDAHSFEEIGNVWLLTILAHTIVEGERKGTQKKGPLEGVILVRLSIEK